MANFKMIFDVSQSGMDSVMAKAKALEQQFGKMSNMKVTNPVFGQSGEITGGQIAATFKGINAEAKKATPHTNDLVKALRRAAIVAPIWMLARNAIMAVGNTITDQIKFLVEFETAMARIKIVGKGTEKEYTLLTKALIDLGHAYGASSSEAAEAAVLFAQQGRNIQETITLTSAAMLASKILGTDIKTAVNNMTAAVEGFQLGVGDSTKIVDKWINVEKQFAVTSEDLANATKVAGAAANQLGITMDEFLGDVTAVIEVTRKTGAEAARGLTFIYARLLTSAKTTIEQIAKVPFYLDETGKASYEVSTSLRSMSSIIEDLASKWAGLDTQEKLSIATSLGSKRQMSVLYALMQNYNASLNARIASLTSAGSAEKAFNIIQDTTATKVKQLSTAWNVLTAAIANTDAFKDSLGFFDKLIISLTTLINYKAGFAAISARENLVMQLANETTLNQVKSLEELLGVRKRLAASPETTENIDRLKLVQTAIDEISKKEPKIKAAIETGTPEELKEVIQKRLDKLEELKVRISLDTEFGSQIAVQNDYIEKARAGIASSTGKAKTEWTKRLALEEEKLTQIYNANEAAVESQLKISRGIAESKKEITEFTESEEEAENELTLQETEKLDILNKINLAKESGLFTDLEMLKLEVKLLSNAKYQDDTHKGSLKIKELEGKMASAQLKDSQDIIDNELELLRIRGATSSQLFQIETALKMQLYGADAVKNSLQYQFDLEKQITKEKLNQVEIGNDSLALYKLAQKFGVDAAKDVGALLSGQVSARGFENRASNAAKEGYAEFFASRKEAEDAATFFGLTGGRGGYAEGRNIPIPERNLGLENLSDAKNKLNKFAGTGVAPSNLVSIQSLEVNVSTDKDNKKSKKEQVEQLQKDMAEAIRTDPKIKQAIEERINEF